jgi:tetratricopeptide (TPR) repeat protein
MESRAFKPRYLAIILFVLSFVLFARTLNFEFVWDDERSHLKNAAVMTGDHKSIWSKPYDGMFIPLTYSTWALVKKASWDDETKKILPRNFHLLNIVFHGINAVLVFQLLLLLFKSKPAAFTGALIFILHPLQVESVAWISEFRGVYSTAFGLSALYLMLKQIAQNPGQGASYFLRSGIFFISTLLLICALLSKPSAVVFPFIAVVLTWCFYRESFRKSLWLYSVWLLITLPFLLITTFSQTNDVMNFVAEPLSRPFLFFYSAWFYVTKICMPFKLAPCYGITPQVILEDSWLYLYSTLVVAIAIYLFVKRKKYPHLFSSILILFAVIAPVSGLITFYYQRYSNVADRYMYPAMIALAMLVAFFWDFGARKKISRIVIILFIILCSVPTIKQTAVWRNEFTIWDHSMKHYPEQFTAAYNRGIIYGKNGDLQKAIADYSIALTYNQTEKSVYMNRANAYSALGKFSDAQKDYSEAIKIDSTDGSIYYNRALSNYYSGNFRASAEDLVKSQRLGFRGDPKFDKALKYELQKGKK